MLAKILIVYLSLCFYIASGQNDIDQSILKKCNTADKINYLSNDEKQVILYVNLVRNYPQIFLEKIAKPFIYSLNYYKSNDFYTNSLIKELKQLEPVGFLYVDEKLYRIAKGYAKTIGFNGETGHNITAKYIDGENLAFGEETPIEMVMSLLIDHGVKSLGHRRNILYPSYTHIAVAIEKHKYYSIMCVMDFKR